MKNKVALLMWGAAGLLGLYLVWGWLNPSHEKVIRKRLGDIQRLASFGPNEAPLAKLANTDKLLGYFAPQVQAAVSVPGRQEITFNSREDLRQAAMGARAQLTSLKIEFGDPKVLLGPDKRTAVMLVGVRADGATGNEPFIERLRLDWALVDGTWMVSKLERAPVVH